ncbi:MAG: hypothetical protein Q9208_003583 [Pyrenodesmia sp. 3 TL-2023]
MGTRGLRIIKFRGRNWIFYNHWDSYLDGMGDSLVNNIPTDPLQYQKWLQAQREFFAKWDDLLRKILCIEPDQLLTIESDTSLEHVWGEAFDERLVEGERTPPTYRLGFKGIFIEYTYTIDLDVEVFSIDSSAHYRLDHIPRNGEWMKPLFFEGRSRLYRPPRRVILPQYNSIPVESEASLAVENNTFPTDALQCWESLQIREVEVTIPARSVVASLRLALFDIFQKRQVEHLTVCLLGWKSEDLPFREIAFFIVCLAAGGERLAIVDERRIVKPCWSDMVAGMISGSDPHGERELISSVATGFHMQGHPMGSAPAASKYWFEGALVCLVPRLDKGDNVKKGIADAIQYGRNECGRNSFNAVLISICDIVFLRSFPNGAVEHSSVMPLIGTRGTAGMSTLERFGDEWVKIQAARQIQLAAQKATAAEEASKDELKKGTTEDDNQDETADTKDDKSIAESVDHDSFKSEDTFLSLTQFFEATTLGSLKPTSDNGRKLPTEILKMILEYVSDMKTYTACERVSRSFRNLCHERPLIMDDIALFEPSKDPGTAEADTHAAEANRVPQSYRALELSSGWEMQVNLPSRKYQEKQQGCLVVIGSEWNRKSFLDCPITFDGLELDAPWDEDIYQKPNSFQAWSPRKPDETVWDEVISRFSITASSDAKTLGRFWERLMQKKGVRLSDPDSGDWLLPANTNQKYGNTDWYDHEEYFHFLFLRVKRASKYWGGLWEDVIREAKELLGSVDVDPEVQRTKGPQGEVVGGSDPLVVLGVGLEVRLFEWQQGFDESVQGHARRLASSTSTLKELEPGRTYSITNKEDREVMDEFLSRAEKRLAGAPLKQRGNESNEDGGE